MSRVIAPFAQFFDDAGDPLLRGWLEFFATGSNNTQKATWADKDQTIFNSNPVQLDGAGRAPDIFGQGQYRVVSYENNPATGLPGQQIQVFDPVSAEGVYQGAGGFFSEWSSTVTYQQGYIVYFADNYYASIVDANLGNQPDISLAQWEKVDFVRFWNTNVTYQTGDPVTYDNKFYFSKVDGNIGNQPDISPTEWDAAASGTILFNWGESGTTFQPLNKGYNLGGVANEIGNIYVQTNSDLLMGDAQNARIGSDGTLLNFGVNGFLWQMDGAGALAPKGSYDLGTTLLPVGSIYQGDADKIFLGSGQDAQVFHNGTDFYLNTDTGSILLQIATVTQWTIDASGNLVPNGAKNIGSTVAEVNNIYVSDAGSLLLGSDQDAAIRHSGAELAIQTITGAIVFRTGVGATDRWTIDTNGHLVPASSNTYNIGSTSVLVDNVYLGDNGRTFYGDSQEGAVFHDGASGLYIDATVGQITFRTGASASRWGISSSGVFYPLTDDTYTIGNASNRVQFLFLSQAPTLGDHATNKTYVDPVYVPSDYVLDGAQTKTIDKHLSGIDTAIAAAGSPGSRAITTTTATAGQTDFTHSNTIATEEVYLNGVRLTKTTDYTFTGVTLTLVNAASAGDIITIQTIAEFEITNALDKTGDTMTGFLTLNADPTAVLHAATKQYVDSAVASGVPSGAVMAFAFETPPTGWLECDGSAVSRTTYAALFTAIGVRHGTGDGSTTFNIPDYRGYFLRGWSHGSTTDPDRASRTDSGDGTTGNFVGTKQADINRLHGHTISNVLDNSVGQIAGGGGVGGLNTLKGINADGGNEARPKNINVMYCIKT